MNKRKIALISIAGVACGLVLAGLLQLAMYTFGLNHQTKISCYTPGPTVTNTEYCVYYRHIPGLLGGQKKVLVGPSEDRGVVYGIPPDVTADNIQADWDTATHTVTISMPNSKIVLESSGYIDNR